MGHHLTVMVHDAEPLFMHFLAICTSLEKQIKTLQLKSSITEIKNSLGAQQQI